MSPLLIRTAKRLLPNPLFGVARQYWRQYRGKKFLTQGSSTVTVAGINLEIPEHHPLPGLMAAQPLRDQCVGVTARFTGEKYPDHMMIDIGANVGDTAAIIAEQCSNPLLLVEASDFFHDYLLKNVPKLKNNVSIRKVLVADGNSVSGELFHWGGTAEWKQTPGTVPIPTERLGNLTDDEVCFVKTDTDGHDFKILLAGIDWLAYQRPVILFESQVRNSSDLEESVILMNRLSKIGYMYFIVWDGAGYHMLSTSEASVIDSIHLYLMKMAQSDTPWNLCNLDIACIHSQDKDIFESVSKCYRS